MQTVNNIHFNGHQRMSAPFRLKDQYLFWILLLLGIYEGQIQYFQPKGFNLFKITVASMMFIAFCLMIIMFRRRVTKPLTFSPFITIYYVVYLIYCVVTVFRSYESEQQVIANLFGNYTTGVGLLVPLIAVNGDRIINHVTVLKTALPLLWVGIFLTPLGFVENRMALFASPFVQLSYLLLPFWVYLNKKQRQLLIAGLLACLLTGLLTNVRSVLVRELTVISLIVSFLTLKQKPTLTIIGVLIVIIAFITLTTYSQEIFKLWNTREIEFLGVKIDNDQNRGWMYEEVIFDLTKEDDLTVGRGALGKYFSSFFYSVYEYEGESADDYYRYNIEVGVLAYLLKGGYILLFGTIFILISAALLAFFRSKNTFIKCLGLVVLAHILIMFVENYPKLAMYDLLVWFYVGSCLSIKQRYSEFILPTSKPQRKSFEGLRKPIHHVPV